MGRGTVSFDQDRCKGCQLCVSVCPVTIIELDRNSTNAKGYNPAYVTADNADSCLGCTQCGLMCPDSVITVARN